MRRRFVQIFIVSALPRSFANLFLDRLINSYNITKIKLETFEVSTSLSNMNLFWPVVVFEN